MPPKIRSSIHSQIIVAGKKRDINSAKAAFQVALDRGTASKKTFTLMIKAMAECDDFPTVLQLYKKAWEMGFMDNKLFNSTIQAAGMCNNTKWLRKVYRATLKAKQQDVKTYNIAITAFARCGLIKEAREVFNDAIKDIGTVNAVTNNSMIVAEGMCGDLQHLKEVYRHAMMNNLIDSDTDPYMTAAMTKLAGDLGYMADVKRMREKIVSPKTSSSSSSQALNLLKCAPPKSVQENNPDAQVSVQAQDVPVSMPESKVEKNKEDDLQPQHVSLLAQIVHAPIPGSKAEILQQNIENHPFVKHCQSVSLFARMPWPWNVKDIRQVSGEPRTIPTL